MWHKYPILCHHISSGYPTNALHCLLDGMLLFSLEGAEWDKNQKSWRTGPLVLLSASNGYLFLTQNTNKAVQYYVNAVAFGRAEGESFEGQYFVIESLLSVCIIWWMQFLELLCWDPWFSITRSWWVLVQSCTWDFSLVIYWHGKLWVCLWATGLLPLVRSLFLFGDHVFILHFCIFCAEVWYCSPLVEISNEN